MSRTVPVQLASATADVVCQLRVPEWLPGSHTVTGSAWPAADMHMPSGLQEAD